METDNAPYQGKTMITELNQLPEETQDELIAADSDHEEERSNQIFNVREAVPPTDYEAPYSLLPEGVVLKRVKEKVKVSYITMQKKKREEIEEKRLKQKQSSILKNTGSLILKNDN